MKNADDNLQDKLKEAEMTILKKTMNEMAGLQKKVLAHQEGDRLESIDEWNA